MKKLALVLSLSVLFITQAQAGARPWPPDLYNRESRWPHQYWQDQEGFMYPPGNMYQNRHYRRAPPDWYGPEPNWFGYPGPPF